MTIKVVRLFLPQNIINLFSNYFIFHFLNLCTFCLTYVFTFKFKKLRLLPWKNHAWDDFHIFLITCLNYKLTSKNVTRTILLKKIYTFYVFKIFSIWVFKTLVKSMIDWLTDQTEVDWSENKRGWFSLVKFKIEKFKKYFIESKRSIDRHLLIDCRCQFEHLLNWP